jgi:HlyD family secretion protein
MPAAWHVRRRLVLWTIAVLAVGALLFITFRPSAVPVDLAEVQRGALQVTLDHEGQTRVHDRYVVSAPVAGRVLRIEAEAGDLVAANKTVLAEFLPTAPALLDARTRAEAEARIKAADAAVAGAMAARDQSQTTAKYADTQRDRVERLFAAGAASKSDLDAAVTTAAERADDVQHARAAVATAQHELVAAQAVLVNANADSLGGAPVLVRAPIDGVVLQRLHESEAVVPTGEPLIELADPADLEIVSDYLSTDAVQMRPGMAVGIDRWGGGAPLHGRVRLVEPHGFLKVSALGVEEQRVNVVVAFDDARNAWQALGDGYRVETHVVLWETADALKVPSSALFRQGSGWAVFVDEDGRARLRSVEIGKQSGFDAQVLGGLTEHEQVLAHPSDAVTDGVRIAPRR